MSEGRFPIPKYHMAGKQAPFHASHLSGNSVNFVQVGYVANAVFLNNLNMVFRNLDFLVVPHLPCLNWENCVICLKRKIFNINLEMTKRSVLRSYLDSRDGLQKTVTVEQAEETNSVVEDLSLEKGTKQLMSNTESKCGKQEYSFTAEAVKKNNKVIELENELKISRETIESLQASITELREENENLQLKKNELEEELRNANRCLDESEIKIEELNECLSKKTCRIEELERKCSNVIQQWSSEHRLLPIVQDELKGYISESVRLNTLIEGKNKTIEFLQKSLSLAKSNYESCMKDLQQKNDQLSKLGRGIEKNETKFNTQLQPMLLHPVIDEKSVQQPQLLLDTAEQRQDEYSCSQNDGACGPAVKNQKGSLLHHLKKLNRIA